MIINYFISSLNLKRNDFTDALAAHGALPLALKHYLSAGAAQTDVLAGFSNGILRVCQANYAFRGVAVVICAAGFEPVGLGQFE